MCGCWRRAASWISRSNRSTFTPAADLGREHLDDDLPAEPRLLGEEDAAHPAAAELALDAVGVADHRLQAGRELDDRQAPKEGGVGLEKS